MNVNTKLLVFLWASLSITVIFYYNFIAENMTLHEVSAAIYFMGVYGIGIALYADVLKKDRPRSIEEQIKDLDLVPIPECLMPGCSEMYPAIRIYRVYELPKLDSEDIFATYKRLGLVHPAAALEKDDMIQRKDLAQVSY